jgi:hypothetical protein
MSVPNLVKIHSEILRSEHRSGRGKGIRSNGATSPLAAPGGVTEAELGQGTEVRVLGSTVVNHLDHQSVKVAEP